MGGFAEDGRDRIIAFSLFRSRSQIIILISGHGLASKAVIQVSFSLTSLGVP